MPARVMAHARQAGCRKLALGLKKEGNFHVNNLTNKFIFITIDRNIYASRNVDVGVYFSQLMQHSVSLT
jgi:hypothetical protein